MAFRQLTWSIFVAVDVGSKPYSTVTVLHLCRKASKTRHLLVRLEDELEHLRISQESTKRFTLITGSREFRHGNILDTKTSAQSRILTTAATNLGFASNFSIRRGADSASVIFITFWRTVFYENGSWIIR